MDDLGRDPAWPTKKVSEGWASVLLMVCCLFWGLSFPLMAMVKAGFRSLQTTAGESALGATANGWRFLVAAGLLMIPVLFARRRFTGIEIRGGSALGLTYGGGMFLQILGLAWIAPSVSGMITAMPVLLAPMVQAGLLRRPVPASLWTAAGIALIGSLVLTLGPAATESPGSLTVPAPFPFAGELATFACALCFTAHIRLIDHYGPRCGSTRLTVIMFIVVGFGNLGAAFGFGALPLHSTAALAALAGDRTWLWGMLTLIVFCSVLTLWLMNRAQPSLSPARAAVLYTLEPVFAVLFSILLGQERMAWKTLVGGALILGAAIFSTREWSPRRRPVPRGQS